MSKEYKEGDRVVIIDIDGARNVTLGDQATVVSQEGERLWVVFDKDTAGSNRHGNVRRFRKLTKLDKALR